MILEIEAVSMLTGALSGVIGNWLYGKSVLPGIEKAKLQKEFKQLFDIALLKLKEKTPDLLIDISRLQLSKGKLNKLMVDEFEKCIHSLNDFIYPSSKKLYSEYCSILENKQESPLSMDRFSLIISALWYTYIETLKIFPPIHKFLLKEYKIIFHEKHITDYEALILMKQYCKTRLLECEKQIIEKYQIKNFPVNFEQHENVNEFCTYLPTPMVFEIRDSLSLAKEEEQKNIFDNNFSFTIYTGIGGVGKTRFFEELERKNLRIQLESGEPTYLPILISASDIGYELNGATKIVAKKIEHVLLNSSDLDIVIDNIPNKSEALSEYLRLRKNKLFLLVDGFDQVDRKQTQKIIDRLISNYGYGKSCCYVTTRPFRQRNIWNKVKEKGIEFCMIRIEPFNNELLEKYCGKHFNQIQNIASELKRRDISTGDGKETLQVQKDVHLLQVPLLIRLLKELVIYGYTDQINNKADLFQVFLNHIVNKQAEKFDMKKDACWAIFKKLEKLSFKLFLKEEGIARTEFSRDQIDEHLMDPFPNIDEMKQFDILKPVLDTENRPLFRFQHQLIQEFFAAKKLWRIYRRKKIWKNKNERKHFFKYLDTIKYDPDEIADFLSLMIATDRRLKLEKEFSFWHKDIVVNPSIKSNWVRTYGLHIRDVIACQRNEGARILEDIFKKENSIIDTTHPMVEVQKGNYIIGSYVQEDERPVELVELKNSFMIDRFLVTNFKFCTFLNDYFPAGAKLVTKDGHRIINLEKSMIKFNGTEYSVKKGYHNHPVTEVRWHGAELYCQWRTENEKLFKTRYRLPTEIEWEIAARGKQGRSYPWGNNFEKDRCNSIESGIGKTTAVGKYIKNGLSPWGCADMSGNAWEWTSSDYLRGSSLKTIRGGAWIDTSRNVRCAIRSRYIPSERGVNGGFRCARSLEKI